MTSTAVSTGLSGVGQPKRCSVGSCRQTGYLESSTEWLRHMRRISVSHKRQMLCQDGRKIPLERFQSQRNLLCALGDNLANDLSLISWWIASTIALAILSTCDGQSVRRYLTHWKLEHAGLVREVTWFSISSYPS